MPIVTMACAEESVTAERVVAVVCSVLPMLRLQLDLAAHTLQNPDALEGAALQYQLAQPRSVCNTLTQLHLSSVGAISKRDNQARWQAFYILALPRPPAGVTDPKP